MNSDFDAERWIKDFEEGFCWAIGYGLSLSPKSIRVLKRKLRSRIWRQMSAWSAGEFYGPIWFDDEARAAANAHEKEVAVQEREDPTDEEIAIYEAKVARGEL